MDLPPETPGGTTAFVLTKGGDPDVRVGPLLEESTFDDFLKQQSEAGGDGVFWAKPD